MVFAQSGQERRKRGCLASCLKCLFSMKSVVKSAIWRTTRLNFEHSIGLTFCWSRVMAHGTFLCRQYIDNYFSEYIVNTWNRVQQTDIVDFSSLSCFKRSIQVDFSVFSKVLLWFYILYIWYICVLCVYVFSFFLFWMPP